MLTVTLSAVFKATVSYLALAHLKNLVIERNLDSKNSLELMVSSPKNVYTEINIGVIRSVTLATKNPSLGQKYLEVLKYERLL